MSTPTPSYVQIVKDTAPVVGPKALEITQCFYPKMLKNNPEVLRYFNRTNQRSLRQPKALADAVVAYALNIDNLGVLGDAVALMAHKHCALGIQPEDYAVVHKNLMEAVGEVLKVDSTIANGWSEAVLALAGILIQTEKDLYAAAEKRRGGWRGGRKFVVDKVVTEAKDIVSIYFKPKDGKDVPEFTAGQYITIAENPSTEKYFAPRHYTISCKPSDATNHIRITVKKIRSPSADYEDGLMSSYVNALIKGDEVSLHPPFGVAAVPFDDKHNGPIVFLTAGIGITTAVPLAAPEVESKRRPVLFVHADRSPAHHALGCELASTGCPCLFSYSAAGAAAGAKYTSNVTVTDGARLTSAKVLKFVQEKLPETDVKKVQFWLCGPPEFMTAMVHGLCVSGGVPVAHVHHEAFGPAMQMCPGNEKPN